MPPRAATRPIQDSLFGTLAVRFHFVLPQQVDEAIDLQQSCLDAGQPVPRLGEILAQRGYMTDDQVRAVLKGQSTKGNSRFGEVAVAFQFCPEAEVDAALEVQRQIKACGGHQRLGEILVARGKLRPHQVLAVLKSQGKAIVACPSCKARLNVSGFRSGTPVSCPRCKKIFVPGGSSEHPAVSDEPFAETENLRADMSMMLPAVGLPSDGSARSGSTNPGQTVAGQYQLGPVIGTDASGVLYKAFQPKTGVHVALRMLSSHALSGADALERWHSAGEAASELSHPNLQSIVSMNVEGGMAFLVMEYIEGESLRVSMKRRGKFAALEAVDILIQMGEALSYGHAHSLLHGDLRPAHVLIGMDGIVRISGLAIPKNVTSNLRQVAGKLGEEALPLYTPPEIMIEADSADERSDLYSLGAIGYHMLTGRPPHEGSDVMQLGLKIASDALTPPHELESKIQPYISRLICKCLELDPDARYDSAQALLIDLRLARQGLLSGAADVPAIAPEVPQAETGAAPRLARRHSRTGRARTHTPRNAHIQHRTGSGAHRAQSPSGVLRAPTASGILRAQTASGIHRAQTGKSGLQSVVSPTHSRALDDDNLLQELEPNSPEARLNSSRISKAIDAGEFDTRRKQRKGTVEKPGVSAKTVILICGITVVLLGGVIYAISQNQSAPQTERLAATVPAVPLSAAPREDPNVSADWRLVQEYIRDHGQDLPGMVDRLHGFELKYSESEKSTQFGAAEKAKLQQAREQLKQYSSLGANSSLPALRDQQVKMIEADKFDGAAQEIERWKSQWHFADETVGKAKSMLDELAAKQKQLAEQHMQDAARLRQEKKWTEAYPLYQRVIANFASVYSDPARKALLEAEVEERAGRGEAEREASAHKDAEQHAAREASAPAHFQQLVSDMDNALKTFDLQQAKSLIDTGAEALTGTSKGPDLQDLKNDLKRLIDLRDRIVKAAAAGKLRAERVNYQGQQYLIIECTERGPVIEAAAGGKLPVSWSDLTPEDLIEVARHSSDSDSGQEMLDLGMLRYHLGKYTEARQTLILAQKQGALVSRYMPLVEAKLQAGGKPAESNPTTPAKDNNLAPVAPVAPGAVVGAKPEQAAPPASPTPSDPDVVRQLGERNLEPKLGIWKIATGNIMQAFPNPAHATPNIMTLKRPIKKTFKTISLEVRGMGESAGFSFGTGKRYVIHPEETWQKISVERKEKEVVFTVNGKVMASLDDIAKEVTPDNLAEEGHVYIRFNGTKGEFRYITVSE